MADIPKDPRQLARDILSGKITIEEVARARRAAIEAGQQAKSVPDKIPLPNISRTTPPVKPPLIRGPVPQGPMGRRPTQKMPLPPRSPAPTQGRAPSTPQGQMSRPFPRPTATVPPSRPSLNTSAEISPPTPVPGGTPTPAGDYAASQTLRAATLASTVAAKTNTSIGVREMLSQPQTFRQAILVSEILNKPVSLRDEW